MTDEKMIEIKRGTGVMADLLNQEMDSLIKSFKCGDCVHLPLCMAQKGGVNLGLASENDCMYYQPKLPENAVMLTKEEHKQWLKDCIESNKVVEERTRKETAMEILKEVLEFAYRSLKIFGCIEEVDFEVLCNEIAKRYGVEVE